MTPTAKRLVIVESVGKVKKIQSYLGDDYRVLASMGHIRDLPTDTLGVDVAADFAPQWVNMKGKSAIIKRLTKAMQSAETIYLATDPDREGEAIAAHLRELAQNKPMQRITFTAITQGAVQAAIQQPREVDQQLVAAQHARRKLDRLVGYLVSPIACRVLDGRYSAGRVQSPALRLVVERERAIRAFTPETYYTLEVMLGITDVTFTAKLTQLQDRDLPLKDAAVVKRLANLLQQARYGVKDVATEDALRRPPKPFTTSTLQQVASSQLGLAPEKTMKLAQQLYEVGLITYMRTDAVTIDRNAQTHIREFITEQYGAGYVPNKRPTYTNKANAQAAHEAIRPTDVAMTPKTIPPDMGDGAALYNLIWRRTVASQMTAAVDTVQTATIWAGKTLDKPFPLTLQARGKSNKFDGFRRVYRVEADVETDDESENNAALPALSAGQQLIVHQVQPQRKQTTPPARFTEAQLVRELEKRGIGRPSTYASILSNIKSRGYVQIEKKRLVPTPSGITLLDYLHSHFALILSDDYTARMERLLDAIAAGKVTELETLTAFWQEFQPLLRDATAELTPPKTGETCPQCGRDLVKRTGKKGAFIGCAGFPECRYTVGLEHQPLLIQPAS